MGSGGTPTTPGWWHTWTGEPSVLDWTGLDWTPRLGTHVISAILNVGQSVEEDWPLYIKDNDGGDHKVVLAAGSYWLLYIKDNDKVREGRVYWDLKLSCVSGLVFACMPMATFSLEWVYCRWIFLHFLTNDKICHA